MRPLWRPTRSTIVQTLLFISGGVFFALLPMMDRKAASTPYFWYASGAVMAAVGVGIFVSPPFRVWFNEQMLKRGRVEDVVPLIDLLEAEYESVCAGCREQIWGECDNCTAIENGRPTIVEIERGPYALMPMRINTGGAGMDDVFFVAVYRNHGWRPTGLSVMADSPERAKCVLEDSFKSYRVSQESSEEQPDE